MLVAGGPLEEVGALRPFRVDLAENVASAVGVGHHRLSA